MVFCRECNAQVEDCVHFVSPLNVPAVEVFDPKVRCLAYKTDARILEITFKNGQVWQLFGVKPDIYEELLHATLSSFLKFLAHRYKAAPVRQRERGTPAASAEPCPACRQPMTEQHRTAGGAPRILWHCERCNQSLWRSYATESVRERRAR
jgi:hypothetical protein